MNKHEAFVRYVEALARQNPASPAYSLGNTAAELLKLQEEHVGSFDPDEGHSQALKVVLDWLKKQRENEAAAEEVLEEVVISIEHALEHDLYVPEKLK